MDQVSDIQMLTNFINFFRVLCPNLSTHKVVSVHLGEGLDSDTLEAVDFDSERIAGLVKR